MAYKTDWKLDDIVKPEDMNRIEGGLQTIDNNYVPLDGGVMHQGAALTFPHSAGGTRKAKVDSNGLSVFAATDSGWASGVYFRAQDADFTTLSGIGAYGGGNTLSYVYVGAKYNEPWCKFTSDGTVTAKLFDGAAKSANSINYIDVPAGSDLNSITTVGFHRCQMDSTAAGLTNCPVSKAFFMLVGMGTSYFQELTTYTGYKYYRSRIDSSWGAWTQVYTTINKPTLSTLGVTATATELNYMDGVTSAVQTQLNAKATTKTFTATIPTTGWTTSAPYSKYVAVSGMQSTDKPIVTPVYTGTLATDQAMEESWNLIDRIVTGSGGFTVYAFDEVPTTAIPIQLQVVR